MRDGCRFHVKNAIVHLIFCALSLASSVQNYHTSFLKLCSTYKYYITARFLRALGPLGGSGHQPSGRAEVWAECPNHAWCACKNSILHSGILVRLLMLACGASGHCSIVVSIALTSCIWV